MEYQSLLHKKLHSGAFVFTAETTPPDSSDKEVLLNEMEEKFNKLEEEYAEYKKSVDEKYSVTINKLKDQLKFMK